jgi:ATP-dependent DNA helicase RecG
MDNQTYREINKVDTLAASKALRRLRDAGLVHPEGPRLGHLVPAHRSDVGRLERHYRQPDSGWGRACCPRHCRAGVSSNQGVVSSNPGGLTSNPEALSSNLDGLTSNPAALGSNLPSREDHLDDPRRQALLNELPGGLAARVGAIGRRHPPQEVKDLVVSLCEIRAWRAEELAALLGRKPETVRQDYLRALLRAGRIAMTRPDKPNDPDQAYRASAAT